MSDALEIVPQGNMVRIKWKGKPGPVPEALQGAFTSKSVAEKAVKLFFDAARSKDKKPKARN